MPDACPMHAQCMLLARDMFHPARQGLRRVARGQCRSVSRRPRQALICAAHRGHFRRQRGRQHGKLRAQEESLQAGAVPLQFRGSSCLAAMTSPRTSDPPVQPPARALDAVGARRIAAYCPPHAQRANLAVGAAPMVVLLSFTALVSGLIDVETALAWFLGCTVWVVHEMNDFTHQTARYDADYVARHLAWRSNDTLLWLAEAGHTDAATRRFVRRYVQAGRQVLPDGVRL